MGRGRKKQQATRKRKSMQRRMLRRKAGKPVYFSLSNYSKQLHGTKERYYQKPNLHNVNFRKSEFYNCRFKGGHITNSSMREVVFTGCDFIKINFRETSFRNAKFINCYFFQCNLKDSNFANATFKNTYFVSTSVKNAKNILINQSYILNQYPDMVISDRLSDSIKYLDSFTKIKKYGVLSTDKHKVNKWTLSILLKEFSENKILLFLDKISRNTSKRQKKMITLNNFREDLIKYAPNMV